jgi:putative ribosome biogenesis GTPase RsgA
VYSITDDTSFAKLDGIRAEALAKLAGRPVPFFLVGTKRDLATDRAVSEKERVAKARAWGCESFEISSKENEGVADVFERMAQAVLAVSGEKGTGPGSMLGAGKVMIDTKAGASSAPAPLPTISLGGGAWRKKVCSYL